MAYSVCTDHMNVLVNTIIFMSEASGELSLATSSMFFSS